MGSCRRLLFLPHYPGDHRTSNAISGRRRSVCLDAGGLRRFPRIRRWLVVLGLLLLLFSRTAAGEHCNECLHRRRGPRPLGQQSQVSRHRLAVAAGGRRRHEHCRSQHRQVAAERRRCGHIYSVADPARNRRDGVCTLRISDADPLAQHAPSLELQHRELLVTDRVCVHGHGTSLRHVRRSARPEENFSASHPRIWSAYRSDLHVGHDSHVSACETS